MIRRRIGEAVNSEIHRYIEKGVDDAYYSAKGCLDSMAFMGVTVDEGKAFLDRTAGNCRRFVDKTMKEVSTFLDDNERKYYRDYAEEKLEKLYRHINWAYALMSEGEDA